MAMTWDEETDRIIARKVADHRRRLDGRFVVAVAKHLNVRDADVSLVRWIEQATGDIPVFAVPLAVVDRARRMGLTVEAMQ